MKANLHVKFIGRCISSGYIYAKIEKIGRLLYSKKRKSREKWRRI